MLFHEKHTNILLVGQDSKLKNETKKKILNDRIGLGNLILIEPSLNKCDQGKEFLLPLTRVVRTTESNIVVDIKEFNDIPARTIIQMDHVLLFPKIPDEKLKIVHHNLDIRIPFEKFVELYTDGTKDKADFLYIQIHPEEFRKNFDQKYEIKE